LLLGSHSDIISIGELKQMDRYVRDKKECTCGCLVEECPFWMAVRDRIRDTTGEDLFSRHPSFPLIFDRSSSRLLYSMWQFVRLSILSMPTSIAKRCIRWVRSETEVAENSLKVYDAVLHVSGKRVVVDSSKSPILMKLLMLLRPKRVLAIHLIRDGRAVLNSNLKKGKETAFAARSWTKTLDLMDLLSKKIRRNRYLEIKYEDICRNPEAVLKTVCEAAGLPFEPDMLKFRNRERHNIDGNRMRYAETDEIRLDERWRNELNEEQLAVFEDIAGKHNRRLGYL
jgi:hypothetical protein